MKIALFDFKVVPNNPVGGCHYRMLRALANEHEFTVFAVKFDNPSPQRIRFVHVPVPQRPLALAFVVFHVMAPIRYWFHRLFTGRRFDLVQAVESNLLMRADVDYTQFCHRAFLREHWPAVKGTGLRATLRKLDHWLHTLTEPMVYRRARKVVVSSIGLQQELLEEYPVAAGKMIVLSNPVDIDKMKQPAEFDRAAERRKLGYEPGDVVLCFVALGHYERKGLPLLLEALQRINHPSLKVLVVGGENDLVRSYQRKVAALGLSEQKVQFVGMQTDVRPYFWLSDAFAFPSSYETFSLVTFEAAAAGLPIIVTPLHGVNELVRDRHNALVVERSVDGVARGVQCFLSMSSEQRAAMGKQAQSDVRRFSLEAFEDGWRMIYQGFRQSATA